MTIRCLVAAGLALSFLAPQAPAGRDNTDQRPRVIVSTDIGGTDPDDFQSMVHFLVYSDMVEVEGLISSPYGPGRREHIEHVIETYAVDYPHLIEANSTYRGWFTGGDQTGEWDNKAFVTKHVAGRGALGGFFATQLQGAVKMGDSPSVVYALRRTRDDPSQSGWGGRFVRVWDDRKTVFERTTTADDKVEVFGVVEFALPIPAGLTRAYSARMIFDNRVPAVGINDGRALRFRFSPRDAKVWSYVIRSDYTPLDGMEGRFTAVPPSPEQTRRPSSVHPHWWTDDQDPSVAEGIHPGARSVNQWRRAFLEEFASRMERCRTPRGSR